METRRPVIGIIATTQYEQTEMFASEPQIRIRQNKAYIMAIESNGGVALMLTPMAPKSLQAQLELCDGFLLPGGEDVNPAMYREMVLPECGVYRPDMDCEWGEVLQYAVDRGKPVFGICRGLQFINAFLGGTLYQDMKYQEKATGTAVGEHAQRFDRHMLSHTISIQPYTNLHEILGADLLKTNSMHHQSICRLGRGLEISARALDGTIEAIENKNGLIMAVQWHPEELYADYPEMNRLFESFVDRCR